MEPTVYVTTMLRRSQAHAGQRKPYLNLILEYYYGILLSRMKHVTFALISFPVIYLFTYHFLTLYHRCSNQEPLDWICGVYPTTLGYPTCIYKYNNDIIHFTQFSENGLWWPRRFLPPRSQTHITFFENATTATNSTNFNWFLVKISLFFGT